MKQNMCLKIRIMFQRERNLCIHTSFEIIGTVFVHQMIDLMSTFEYENKVHITRVYDSLLI